MNGAMKPVWGLFVILIGMIAVVGLSKLLQPKEIIPWRTDYAAARAEARRSGKLMFAYFTAEWCQPCQGLKRTTWADKNVNAALASYVPVKIDVDRYGELARKYEIDILPRFTIMDADGTVRRTSEGAMEPDELLAWLKG